MSVSSNRLHLFLGVFMSFLCLDKRSSLGPLSGFGLLDSGQAAQSMQIVFFGGAIAFQLDFAPEPSASTVGWSVARSN